jgi:hypothetical protein
VHAVEAETKAAKVGEGMKQNAFKSRRRALFALALVAEVVLLYYGFSFLLLGYTPLKHRLIGSAVFFPLAALAAWWSGSLFIRNLPTELRNGAKIIKTFPVILLLCVCSAAAAISILVLLGFF